MLARIGEPFDADDHLFEVKWDGVRAIAYVEAGSLRLHGRRRRDLAGRYPELDVLRGLPDGTVLDGELVVLQADGRPDFRAILARENGTSARAAAAARTSPVHYVVFDLLWLGFTPLLDRPLAERRQALEGLVAGAHAPGLLLSEGVVGRGRDLFAAVCERGLEGVVAKRLAAPYRPGERGDAWQKIKPRQVVHCLVLGYEPDGERDFKSLIVATDFDGELQCVGKVGSGLDQASKARLREWLFARRSPRPLVPTALTGVWVQPGLFCRVGFLERTPGGALRAPVFLGMVDPGSQ
jgi:DNA ligase D-like protein (predicted ligase)